MGNRGTFTFPGKSRSQPQDFPAVGIGLFSQLPPAGYPGRMYFTTDSQKMYVDNGVTWTPLAPPPMIGHSETTVTINTTNVESDLLTSCSIPAATLAVGDRFRLRAFGDYINNSGSTSNNTWKAYFGATTFTTGALSVTPIANTAHWQFEMMGAVTGASAENVGVIFQASSNQSGNDFAQPAFTAGSMALQLGAKTGAAEAVSGAITLRFTVTPSVSNVNNQYRSFGWSIERLVA